MTNATQMTKLASQYDRFRLENGLRLLTIPLVGGDSVSVLILVGVGSRHETAEINGISHFLEHMFAKGSAKRPTAFDISVEIDRIGGVSNAFTAKDHSGYFVKAASQHLPLALDVLTDMLLRPKLEPSKIEREKGVILEEINFRNDTPITRIADHFETLLYGDHPLGWTIDGRPEVIKRLTRDDFVGYFKKHYLPNKMVVAVAGNIDPAQVYDLVSQAFALQSADKLIKPKKNTLVQTKPAVSFHPKETDQIHFILGVRAYPISHPKRYAASLLTTILGRGMSSRLFIEVREKQGLAYYVSSDLEEYAETGYLATRAGVDLRRYQEALKIIALEYRKLGQEKVKPKELTKAKEYLKGRLVLSIEDSMTVASSYATQELLEEKIETPEMMIAKIEQITADQIQEVAQEIFVPEKLNLAILGPEAIGKDGPFQQLLEGLKT